MSLLCTTISLVLGLYFFRNNLALSIIISLVYIVFIFVRFSKKRAIVFLTVFIGGAFIGNLNIKYDNQDNIYQGMVVEVKENYFIFQSHFEKYYVYDENSDKEIGDFLTIKSKPSEFKVTTYESQFNFANYLKDKGVTRSLVLNDFEINFTNPIRLHSRKKIFLAKFNENSQGLIDALLFNEKDYSNPVIAAFAELNLIYLISISGIYLHSLFKGTTYVFGLFSSKKVAELVPILLFSPIALFSFPRISILRVFLLTSLRYINEHFLKKRFSYLTLLSGLSLFFLIIDYHLVYQEAFYIGFLLSLLGVFYRTGINYFPSRKRKYYLSIFAYLFLLPIMSANKNLFHLFSFPLQLMLIPFITIYIILILPSIVRIPLTSLINSYSNFLVGISKSLLKLDISLPIKVNEWFFLVYYASFILALYLLESQRIRHLRNVVIALVSFICISILPIRLPNNSVHFINVGQGDSILLCNRNKYVLIDTGGNTKFDMAEETLIPYFRKIGVSHIDLLVTSHDDFDHAGAASSLVENFKVKSYLKERSDFPIKVGDIKLENINYYDGDENDSSLVFLVDFMKKKWLFTGDASIESEKYILNSGIDVDCDILKVGHHGSKTSSCEEFIKATSPSEAVISCGAKNKYGHPNKEVIETLTKYNVKIRRTDLEGTISYVSMFA